MTAHPAKIVDCAACGKPVSIEASACPHCGHPVKRKAGALFWPPWFTGPGWWWKTPFEIAILAIGLVLLWDALHGSPILSDALRGFAQRTNNPDCASEATKATVTEIAKKNKALRIAAAGGTQFDNSERYQTKLHEQCGGVWTDNHFFPVDLTDLVCAGNFRKEYNNKYDQAIAGAIYSLDFIRMTAKDSTMGSVSCAADLHVALPNDLGSAEEPITYEIEKTSDGKLYVSVRGLQ